jgi:dihydrofolate reductase
MSDTTTTATTEERMAKLIYSAIMSLDGYIEDEDGKFGWAEPDEEVHGFVNDEMRSIGTHLYGRRMYETLAVWETDASHAAVSPVTADFAEIWQAADKVVYSTTLDAPTTRRTRIERAFDPAAVRELKAAAGADLLVGGPDLAGHAFRAGLVDEVRLLLAPVAVGRGKPALPQDVRVPLALVDERRFAGGMVHLRYRAAR